MVGISGPAGIGKSTIARALHSKLSNSFQCNGFMDKFRGSYHSSGLDKYGLQLYLQEQLLSKVMNLEGIRISNLGVMKDRLQYQKVLIILDDVESLDQLEALANDLTWFGPGSRVIVTTENKELLQQHKISDIYQVGFPSKREAVQIFCLSAFKQISPPNGFMYLAYEVVRICGNLPLSLHVLGSSLREKSQAEWNNELPRLKNCLNGRIESVLKVGYECLDEKDQDLFLLVAVFFNHKHVDHVISILLNTKVVDVKLGLKNLANRYLIHIDGECRVKVHRLLIVMARHVNFKQDPSKRRILDHAEDICFVLENAEGTGSVLGLSLDVAEINELKIKKKAFKRMYNLKILKVYDGKSTERELHVPEEMEFPRFIQLFHWDAYPGKILHRFCPENLVELIMPYSQLDKLWEGRQLLANLKKMNLRYSFGLKELPDLSNATNLEELDVYRCTALVELPSSIVNLHKISSLDLRGCQSLEVIPTLAKLTSLGSFMVTGCSQLRRFPDIPHNFEKLQILDLGVEELPASLRHCSRLREVRILGNKNLKTFLTHLPTSVTKLDLTDCGIERITDCIKGLHNLEYLILSGCERLESLPELPDSLKILYLRRCKRLVSLAELPDSLEELWASDCGIERTTDCIKGLHNLKQLDLSGCERLESLPELPDSLENLDLSRCKRLVSLPELHGSLKELRACDCESLERLSDRLSTPKAELDFTNCLKLDGQAQRTIIQQLFVCHQGWAFLPGREVPAEFDYRATGNYLTIPHSSFNRFTVCIVISYERDCIVRQLFPSYCEEFKISVLYRFTSMGHSVKYSSRMKFSTLTRNNSLLHGTKHLFIFGSNLPVIVPFEVIREIVLEFHSICEEFDIIECGVHILTDEKEGGNNG